VRLGRVEASEQGRVPTMTVLPLNLRLESTDAQWVLILRFDFQKALESRVLSPNIFLYVTIRDLPSDIFL
jgi:hypothetical protein